MDRIRATGKDAGRATQQEVGKIHVVHPSDPSSCRRYEEDLYPSSEALHAPCTAKATVYCAAGLGAFVGGVVAGFALGRPIHSFVIDWTQALCDTL